MSIASNLPAYTRGSTDVQTLDTHYPDSFNFTLMQVNGNAGPNENDVVGASTAWGAIGEPPTLSQGLDWWEVFGYNLSNYIESTTVSSSKYDWFTLESPFTQKNANIFYVRIYAWMESSEGGFEFYIRHNGNTDWGGPYGNNGLGLLTHGWVYNPTTSDFWQWDELDDVEIGIRTQTNPSGTPFVRIYQLWVEVISWDAMQPAYLLGADNVTDSLSAYLEALPAIADEFTLYMTVVKTQSMAVQVRKNVTLEATARKILSLATEIVKSFVITVEA